MFASWSVAEVPCTHVLESARKTWADAAGTSSVVASCPVVRGMTRIPDANAEDRIHALLKSNNLALPLDISPLSGNHVEGYPRIKPLDFLEYMAESGNIHRLLGGHRVSSCRVLLETFWRQYELCHPDFGLFLTTDVDYGTCIPIYAHADGGRGFKKSELLVFNWSSALGIGTGKQNRKDHAVRPVSFKRKTANNPRVNLLGHSYATHYLWAVMPAAWHKDDSTFQAMLTEFGRDLAECFEKGVMVGGVHFRLVLLGLKADLKLQARAGKFKRWYSTCRKGPYDPKKANQTAGWCCWLCGAGDITIPFEEIHTETPAWYQSLPDWIDIPPWGDSPCGLMETSLGYNAHPAKFYLPDLFHIYLAGFGQDHAGSCLVYMLGILFQGSSVEKQLDSLNLAWRLWKRMFKVSTHTYNFTRNMLNFLDAKKVFPTGTWSKASDTPKILEFVLYVCSLYPEKVSTDKVLYYIQSSCQSIGVCMKALYDSDLFMESCLGKWLF